MAGGGRCRRPAPGATLASDGSLDTAIEAIEPAGLVVATPSGFIPRAIELDYGSGRFSRVPASLRVLGRDGGEWSELTDAATGRHLRARAAYQLMRLRSARLVIRLRPGPARELKLVADAGPWDLPELRLRLEPSGPGGVSAAR